MRLKKEFIVYRLLAIFILFLATINVVYSARQPSVQGDNNAWGTILNAYLNVTLDENGSISAAVNNSISLWNASENNIFPKEIGRFVGIGTASPSEILTVIGNVNISGYLNISGDFIVNNKFNVTASSGNVNVAGILDAANLRIQGNNVQVEADAFKLGNFTSGYANEYSSAGYKKGNLSADLAAGVASSILTSTLTSDNIIVNKNMYIIGNISNVNIVNLNINGSLYPSIDSFFDLGDKTFRWRNANFSGTIQAGFFAGDGSLLTGMPYLTAVSNVTNGTDLNLTKLNVVSINGTDLALFNKSIDLSGYLKSFDASVFNLLNLTNYFGGLDVNSSIIKAGNLTTLDTLNNYIRTKDFNLGNISNNTLTKDNNASIALWNITGIRTIAPRIAAVVNITGNITLGNGTSSSPIFFNGSGICINSC